jgi:DNA-binding CsgD family transcriptional regulator
MKQPKSQEGRSQRTLQTAAMIRADEGRKVIKRYTEEGIAKRQEQVKEYLLRGVPKTVMAELLGVSRKTIFQDIRAIEERAGHQTRAIKGNPERTFQEVGMISGRLQAISDAAMSEYALSRTPAAKDRFLNIAIKAIWTRTRVLMETGVLPRAGEEIKVVHQASVTFANRFGPDNPLAVLDDSAARRKVLSALDTVLFQVQQEESGRMIDIRPLPDEAPLPALPGPEAPLEPAPPQ